MSGPLVLPDGVRLPERKELTGPRAERDRLWSRLERAHLRPGYVVRATTSPEFAVFVEANVDASALWTVFSDLARAVLAGPGDAYAPDSSPATPLAAPPATPPSGPLDTSPAAPPAGPLGVECRVLLADAEEELVPVGSAPLERILEALEDARDPLVHDGWLHFGVVREVGDHVSAVLVTPTKHLQIWAQSLEVAAAVCTAHGLERCETLDLLADLPVIVELPEGRETVEVEALRAVLAELLGPET